MSAREPTQVDPRDYAGLSAAYILSRGISKAATRQGWEDPARNVDAGVTEPRQP